LWLFSGGIVIVSRKREKIRSKDVESYEEGLIADGVAVLLDGFDDGVDEGSFFNDAGSGKGVLGGNGSDGKGSGSGGNDGSGGGVTVSGGDGSGQAVSGGNGSGQSVSVDVSVSGVGSGQTVSGQTGVGRDDTGLSGGDDDGENDELVHVD